MEGNTIRRWSSFLVTCVKHPNGFESFEKWSNLRRSWFTAAYTISPMSNVASGSTLARCTSWPLAALGGASTCLQMANRKQVLIALEIEAAVNKPRTSHLAPAKSFGA